MICASKHYFINKVNEQIHPVLYATSWKMSNNFWWNVQHNNNYSTNYVITADKITAVYV